MPGIVCAGLLAVQSPTPPVIGASRLAQTAVFDIVANRTVMAAISKNPWEEQASPLWHNGC
jgi:hypothetical protein